MQDITLQYCMKEHNHFFDFMMLHELLTPACHEITCILWNLRIHYHVHTGHHLTLSCAKSIQSMPSQPISLNLF